MRTVFFSRKDVSVSSCVRSQTPGRTHDARITDSITLLPRTIVAQARVKRRKRTLLRLPSPLSIIFASSCCVCALLFLTLEFWLALPASRPSLGTPVSLR